MSLTGQTITQRSNDTKHNEFIVETHHAVNMLSIEVLFIFIYFHINYRAFRHEHSCKQNCCKKCPFLVRIFKDR